MTRPLFTYIDVVTRQKIWRHSHQKARAKSYTQKINRKKGEAQTFFDGDVIEYGAEQVFPSYIWDRSITPDSGDGGIDGMIAGKPAGIKGTDHIGGRFINPSFNHKRLGKAYYYVLGIWDKWLYRVTIEGWTTQEHFEQVAYFDEMLPSPAWVIDSRDLLDPWVLLQRDIDFSNGNPQF